MAELKGRVRRVSLEFMGPEWDEAYIDFRYLTWPNSKAVRARQQGISNEDRAVEELITTLKDNFVEGKSVGTSGDLIEITAEDIEQLDLDALRSIYERVLGVPDPKV